jgi:methionyl-tRNA formyltransferase
MRVAFISHCQAIDAHLINAVAEHHELVGVLKPGPRLPRQKRRKLTLKKVARKVQSYWYSSYYAKMDVALNQVFFGSAEAEFALPPVDVPRAELQLETGLELMRSWAPDVIVVSGAPILKPVLYEIAPIAVNVHLGLAPDYRGEHTLFMPLLRGDYDRIGATLHRLDAGIDTGAVLARIYPELSPDDDETSLVIKSVQMMARTLNDFLEDLDAGRANKLSGAFPTVRETGGGATPPGGFNIKYADRSVLDDARFRVRRAMGNRPKPRPARVERFY